MEQKIDNPISNFTQIRNLSEYEIDPYTIIKKLWEGRKIFIKSLLISALIGILVSYIVPVTYTSRAILVPQMNTDSKTSGLSGLAALAGINVGISQTSSEISPLIYPLIVKSIPFQLELMKTRLQFDNSSKTITYLEYISESSSFTLKTLLIKYTIGLPNLLLKTLKGNKKDYLQISENNSVIQLTDNENNAKRMLEKIINLDFNVKEGYGTLTVDMAKPIPAAQLGQRAVDLLQKYIIDFKIQKSKADMDFIQDRFNEKKIEFEKAQEELALCIDRNKNFTSGLSSVETDRLQAKYTLTFGVYQELGKQLEQAKIQVKKETPVFSIIEPITIPSEKSKPNRPLILMLFLFIGGIIGAFAVLGKDYYILIANYWAKAETK